MIKKRTILESGGLIKTMVLWAVLGFSGAFATPINVNTATQSELEGIKGIGPSKAKMIIAERAEGGYFEDAKDFQKRVRGVGKKSVEKMMGNGLAIEPVDLMGQPSSKDKKASRASRRGSRNRENPRNPSDTAWSSHQN